MTATTALSPIQPGRACGSCTLCCKVLSIDELQKPQGVWCPKCQVGKGCSIYGSKPTQCSNFYCGFLTIPDLSDYWWPAKSKMILVSELDGGRVAIHVDPGRSTVWRDEPYYSDIKRWAQSAAVEMTQLVVMIGNRAIVMLPDEDVDLGPIAADEHIINVEMKTPFGPKLQAVKLKADDPHIAGRPIGRPFRP